MEMITNQIMVREYSVEQRTKDGYFNGTSLLNYFNSLGKVQKQMNNYKKNQSSIDWINYLIEAEGVEEPIKSSKGLSGATWMHPKVFIDFAMWVSLEFKSKAIEWVLDGLIKSRHDAGDYYNQMAAVVMEDYVSKFQRKPPAHAYMNEANMIREISGISASRNELSESELTLITALQRTNSVLIKKRVGIESRQKMLFVIVESHNL